MDDHRFDNLTRSLASGNTRRGMLKGLAGVVGGALGLSAASTADARTREPNGTACASPRDCAGGLCVDGYCCDTACIGTCEACNVGGAEGICSPVAGAPVGNRGPCPGDGGVCSGQCDGVTTASCAGYAGPETGCGAASCADGWQTGGTCSGNGLCVPSTSHCGLYGCDPDGDVCLASCASDDDCLGEAFCSGGVCAGDLPPGAGCDRPDQCQSGYCANGICCDSACDGECQACGSGGFCEAVPDRETCDGGACCGGVCIDNSACCAADDCPAPDNGAAVCQEQQTCGVTCDSGYVPWCAACYPVVAIPDTTLGQQIAFLIGLLNGGAATVSETEFYDHFTTAWNYDSIKASLMTFQVEAPFTFTGFTETPTETSGAFGFVPHVDEGPRRSGEMNLDENGKISSYLIPAVERC